MIKFRKQHSPAFKPGEIWVSSSGAKVEIVSTVPYEIVDGKYDWDVVYKQSNGYVHDKNGWAFQVRYMHSSDLK